MSPLKLHWCLEALGLGRWELWGWPGRRLREPSWVWQLSPFPLFCCQVSLSGHSFSRHISRTAQWQEDCPGCHSRFSQMWAGAVPLSAPLGYLPLTAGHYHPPTISTPLAVILSFSSPYFHGVPVTVKEIKERESCHSPYSRLRAHYRQLKKWLLITLIFYTHWEPRPYLLQLRFSRAHILMKHPECLAGWGMSRQNGLFLVDIPIYYAVIPEVRPVLQQVPTTSGLLRPLHSCSHVM